MTSTPASPSAASPSAAADAAPLIELAGLVKHYQGSRLWSRGTAPVQAVAGVDLSIAAGDTVGIVGESGCGKSTLGRLIVGLEAPTEGEVRLRGRPRAAMSRRDRRLTRGDVQLMFQDPQASLDPRMSVRRILAEPLLAKGGLSRAERQQRIGELAEEVGLPPDYLDRYPHELSGGQRQRVGLARALAPSPSLIVADEPVSALDVSVRSQILNLMVSLQAQHDLAYLMISHDLSVVRYVSSHIAVMYLGKIVESGTPEELFGRPAHHYTRALIDSIPRPDPGRPPARGAVRGELPSAAAPPSGCRFRTRCPMAQDRCAEAEPPLRSFGGQHLAACHFPLTGPAPAAAASSRPVVTPQAAATGPSHPGDATRQPADQSEPVTGDRPGAAAQGAGAQGAGAAGPGRPEDAARPPTQQTGPAAAAEPTAEPGRPGHQTDKVTEEPGDPAGPPPGDDGQQARRQAGAPAASEGRKQ